MARRLPWFAVIVALALPAWAAPGSSISGFVKNSAGVGQMGAVVRVLRPSGDPITVFTDDRGHYAASDLRPGTYQVKVTAPSYLPALRENVSLAAGAHLLVNMTLNTLFEAVQFLPQQRSSKASDDEWKWTLRSMGNRPILRVLDDGQSVVISSSERAGDRRLKAHLAFVAGSEAAGYGSGADAATVFSLEQSLFSSGTLSFRGNVGYGSGSPAAVVRASYAQEMPYGSRPEIALTMRRLASPGMAAPDAALQALALSVSDTITLADFAELNVGGEFQTIQFVRNVTALRPFGSLTLHLTPDTLLQYRYASSQPNTRAAKGFDTAPADLSESGPRMSLVNGAPLLERARHHELSLSRRFGSTSVQAAVYNDRIANAALLGVGSVSSASGDFLPDVYSNTFTYNGGDLSTTGARLVVQHKFSAALTGTLDYASGGVITLDGLPPGLDALALRLRAERRHALAAKFAGRIPGSKTKWIASYRWVNGPGITPVDWFNASPGQADPYLNVFVRQPVPDSRFLPPNMEVLVDLRNLLAEGYVPVIGRDGQTLYLVQAARSVRGGVAFNF